MKTIQAVAGLCLVLGAPLAMAEAGGFGVGGPQDYIWAEVAMKRMMMARDIADKNKDGMVSEVEWTSSNLHPTSTFYGAFR